MMDIATEIRKLPPRNIRELSQILELNDSWKKLMSIIPKILEKHNYECNITINNLHKYHSEHFKIIENAADRLRSCTEILFDEWGTSGRVRPALGHLLHLLIKAELFRAADYVAEKLLDIERPSRPSDGPAALVTTTLVDSKTNNHIEEILNQIDYPSSVIGNIENNSVDVNINVESSNKYDPVKSIPKIVVNEVQEPRAHVHFSVPVVTERRRHSLTRQNASTEENCTDTDVSDMMKFSQSQVMSVSEDCNDIVPNISTLMDEVSNSTNFTNTETNISTTESTEYVPNITNLMNTGVANQNSDLIAFSRSLGDIPSDMTTFNSDLPDVSALNITSETVIIENDQNVPAFSNLLLSSTIVEENAFIPQINILNSSIESASQELPQISALLSHNDVLQDQISNSKQFLPISIDLLSNSSETSSFALSKNSNASSEISRNSRRNCVSPLPNLSLNTELPHYSYEELQVATNNFDETPHKNCRQVENELAQTNGRFLGSGAFGSVFLALNLIDKPVAVKKLFLKDVDVVNVDDTITKQFRTEVEVLSKYNHANLLSLFGYSCDGPTYCLLYEFIPGGALKDRLQDKQQILHWTDRFNISLGTADAIAYLHTAYSTPLIHRDIKTANILLDCSKKPKLCDFGLIKLIPNQNTNTSTSAFGTSAYMAREAFRGDVSVKLDTFSYGVVLLELITGLPPLDENREGYDIVTHVDEVCEDTGIIPLIDESAGSWTTNNKNFAVELYNISVKCLEENKRKRPTMVEVTNMLRSL